MNLGSRQSPSPFNVPFLWVLGPLIAGILANWHGWHLPIQATVGITTVAYVAAWIFKSRQQHATAFSLWVLGTTCAALAYAHFRNPAPIWDPAWPPLRGELTLKVQQVFRESSRQSSGIAEIIGIGEGPIPFIRPQSPEHDAAVIPTPPEALPPAALPKKKRKRPQPSLTQRPPAIPQAFRSESLTENFEAGKSSEAPFSPPRKRFQRQAWVGRTFWPQAGPHFPALLLGQTVCFSIDKPQSLNDGYNTLQTDFAQGEDSGNKRPETKSASLVLQWPDGTQGPIQPGCVLQAEGTLIYLKDPVKNNLTEQGTPTGEAKHSAEGFNRFLRQSHVYFRFRKAKICQTLAAPPRLQQLCQQANAYCTAILQRSWGPQTASGLYAAMLLGNKQLLNPAQRQRFSLSGTMHFFAVSGLHVGVIAGALWFGFQILGIPYRWSTGLLMLGTLGMYVGLTGAAPSAVRALGMISFYGLGKLLYRQSSAWNAWCACACLTLLYDPSLFWTPSFQLSYAVVGSILLYGLPLAQALNRCRQRRVGADLDALEHPRLWSLSRSLTTSLSISLAATLGSSALSIYYFQTFSPGGIVINLLLMQVGSAIITLGAVSLLLGGLGMGILSQAINTLALALIWLMENAIQMALKLPGVFFSLQFVEPFAFALVGLGIPLWMTLSAHWQTRLSPALRYALPWGLLLVCVNKV